MYRHTHIDMHIHNGFEILFFLEGQEKIEYSDKKTVSCHTNDSLFSKDKTAHNAITPTQTTILAYWEKENGVIF